MKLLIASNFLETKALIQQRFESSKLHFDQITFVNNVDDLIKELKTNKHDFIVCDYFLEDSDIWHIAKLINSTQLAAHILPLFLIKESCEIDIPHILAREHAFKVVPIDDLTHYIFAEHTNNQRTGYRRGSRILKSSILLIEDDEDAVLFAKNGLKHDYEVDIAFDGEAGLSLWQSKHHDLVLLDLMLPKVLGYEVLNQMMAIDGNQPVIIMTGHDTPGNSRDCLLNGASEYLCKPFSIDTLAKRCEVIINRAKLIYQDHYAEIRFKKIANLVWLLDRSLNNNHIVNARRITQSLKSISPCHLSDEEQIKLLSAEIKL